MDKKFICTRFIFISERDITHVSNPVFVDTGKDDRSQNGWRMKMSRNTLIKTTAIFLFFIILTVPSISTNTSSITTVSRPTSVENHEEWYKTFEHSFRDLIETKDGYVGIWTLSSEANLLKFDKNFNLIWKKKIAEDGGSYRSLVETEDGYAIGGVISAGEGDLTVVKTDKEGNVMWKKTYGSSDVEERLRRIAKVSDGFLLVGDIYRSYPSRDRPLIVYKIDENGNIIWNRSFYGNRDKLVWAKGYDAVEIEDGYMIAGIFADPVSPWLIKIDKDGNEIWNKTYNRHVYEATARIIKTSDGNFLVGGWGEGSAYLLKVDQDGNVIWYYSYGGSTTFRDIAEVEDSYVIAGDTKANSLGIVDVILLKVNKSDGGDIICYRQFGSRYDDEDIGLIPEEENFILWGVWSGKMNDEYFYKGFVLKTGDYTPPQIEIVRPKENYLYIFDREICPFRRTLAIGKITIRVNYTNPDDVTLKRMEFYIGKEKEPREVDYSPPYEWTMDFKYWGDVSITCGLYYGDANGVAVDKTSFKVINLKLFS